MKTSIPNRNEVTPISVGENEAKIKKKNETE